jgi:hypothetical protein
VNPRRPDRKPIMAGAGAGFEMLSEVVEAACGEAGGLDAVERRRVAAFLDVSENCLA